MGSAECLQLLVEVANQMPPLDRRHTRAATGRVVCRRRCRWALPQPTGGLDVRRGIAVKAIVPSGRRLIGVRASTAVDLPSAPHTTVTPLRGSIVSRAHRAIVPAIISTHQVILGRVVALHHCVAVFDCQRLCSVEAMLSDGEALALPFALHLPAGLPCVFRLVVVDALDAALLCRFLLDCCPANALHLTTMLLGQRLCFVEAVLSDCEELFLLRGVILRIPCRPPRPGPRIPGDAHDR
mmetsp:Transcript_34795/g.100178  ORF Transcript_34795/g.100178 Transcript_34795/m.100178 type:complete len:239 (+) Transcript_34795:454-1170(+)